MSAYTEPTLTEILDALVAEAKARMTKVKNWSVGGVVRSFLGVAAKGIETLYKVVTSAIALAFADKSTGAYLDRIANLHNRPRKQPRFTAGRVVFGRDVAAGPINIPAGTLVSATASDGQVLRFATDESATLPDGELEVEVEVTAKAAGSLYNVGVGAIDTMISVIPGIDYVRNDQDEYWLDEEGADIETDEELRARLPLVWSELSSTSPDGKFVSIALSIDGVKTAKVVCHGNRGEGTVDLLITGAAGAPTPALIATVQAAIDAAREDLADVLVIGPTMAPQTILINVVASPGGEAGKIQADVEDAIEALFLPSDNAGAYRIGEDFSRAKMIAAALQVAYAANVQVMFPSSDVELNKYQLAQIDTLTVTVGG